LSARTAAAIEMRKHGTFSFAAGGVTFGEISSLMQGKIAET
jgi:hypothetical protein